MRDYDVTNEFVDVKKMKTNQNHKKNDFDEDDFNDEKKSSPKIKRALVSALAVAVLVFAAAISFHFYAASFKNPKNIVELSESQKSEFSSLLDEKFPDQRTKILKNNPALKSKKLDVWAGSAILIDAANGDILFEKNADEVIPPASLTKLFVMYLAFEDAAAGKVSLDDVVPLPEKSWAVNLPRDASLMFLGQGQTVTLRELLKGLAVASGNDAALAVANYISGSTDAFVDRMNEKCAELGLEKTHFVEPSGYDEHNVTTARELASFCCDYIKKYPIGIEEFHSAPSIKYPLGKNLPSWEKDKGDSLAIYQKNTNPLLGVLEGCDGIKTGFIYESGYNLALTAKRDGTRFISVTLRGSGVGGKQGNAGRVHDGTEMMEWAFSNFADFLPEETLEKGFPDGFKVPSIGAKNDSGKFVRLVPAWENAVTIQKKNEKSAKDEAARVKINVQLPKFIYGGVTAGDIYGQIQYVLDDEVLETVPLVADRTQEKGGVFARFLGALVSWKI